MIKIMLEKWDKNKSALKKQLETRTDLNDCEYTDLVKLTFNTIYNDDEYGFGYNLNTDKMTVIDNGDYQGTLLFVIPIDTYQPCESEYLITFVNYGSCSGCDTLLAIQNWGCGKLTESQVNAFMSLCKDLICNTKKLYNNGWRYDARFDEVEEGAK